MQAELIIDSNYELAEGPVWHEGALYWVDIKAGHLHRWDPRIGTCEHRLVEAPLGCAVPCAGGLWLVAIGNALGRFDWATGCLDRLVAPEAGQSLNRFNDGKCDLCGRWWIGSMNAMPVKKATAALYCYQGAGICRAALGGLTISNGLGWSPDGSKFFHTDSCTRRIDVYAYDLSSGILGERRTVAHIAEADGLPDGLAVDVEGHLWVALWGGGAVVRLDGRNGHELGRVPLPVKQVTSCTFGGPALDELFITTAAVGLSGPQRSAQSKAGGLFRVRPGVIGLPVSLGRN
jgi:sugar lactone lactonase YvrE